MLIYLYISYIWIYILFYVSGAQLAAGAVEGLPCPIWKIEKSYSDFGKKDPVCVHLWVEFSFKMQFSKYLWEKLQKFLLAGPLFQLYICNVYI